MSDLLSDLEHHGIKGMRWGIRREETSGVQQGRSDFRRKAIKGAAITAGILAVSGGVVLASRSGHAHDAEAFLKDVPFAWKDAGGQWSTWAPRPGDAIHIPGVRR